MIGDVQTGVLLATPAPTMAGPVLDRLPHTTAHPLATGQGLLYIEIKGRAVKGLMLGMKVQPTGGTPTPSKCFRCQGWGHMAREFPTPATALNQSGGN